MEERAGLFSPGSSLMANTNGDSNVEAPATLTGQDAAVHGPLWRPVSRPNAIRWSDTNFLAVAAGDTVAILSAADLPEGPRGVARPFLASASEMQSAVQGPPSDSRRDIAYSLGAAIRSCSGLQRQAVRDLAWSPPVCRVRASELLAPCCLLAVCTSASRVKRMPSTVNALPYGTPSPLASGMALPLFFHPHTPLL